MNKKILSVCLCLLFFSVIFVSCKSTQRETVSSSAQGSGKAFSSQTITTVSGLKIPDKIIYYSGGKQETFTKDSNKFDNILKLNNQRDKGKLEMLKGAIFPRILNKILKSGRMLVYSYNNTACQSIYFPLDKPSDGRYVFAQKSTPEDLGPVEYGFLSSPDELIHFLKK